MLTPDARRRIRATILDDFDIRARRVYVSPTEPGAAFVQLADGGLVRVELTDDLPTALVDHLPADAVSASAADRRRWMNLPGYVVLD